MVILQKYPDCRRRVIRVLIAALLIQLAFPLHLHAHPAQHTGVGADQRYLHSHSLAHSGDIGHLTGTDTQNVDATPEALAKQSSVPGFYFVPLPALLILLPPSASVERKFLADTRSELPRALRYILAPPLRAPPAR